MIIVIAGPTASGKSRIALQLAKDINGVLINGDSKQIYKELRIGTSRPLESEFENIPHYLFGHISIKEKYNVYKYQKEVYSLLKVIPKDKIPIIVGGTGLYIDSVIYNYKLQKEIYSSKKRILEDKDVKELQKMITPLVLKQLNESDIRNPIRLKRIIEKGDIVKQKGDKMNALYFVINIKKELLEKQIEKRTVQMFNDGLLEENIYLRNNDLINSTSPKIIGYKEFDKYFAGSKTIKEVQLDIIKNTKRYAKRQRTWFKRNDDTIWTDSYNLILEKSVKFINIK